MHSTPSGRISGRLPGLDYNQIPYIDAWGRTESTGGAGKRAADNFLNPSYTSEVGSSPMEDELMRLYKATGEAGLFPDRSRKILYRERRAQRSDGGGVCDLRHRERPALVHSG